MPIVGTAGHVDHGKSTLVAALTGRDPDRWAEEKERGLTIDLGFAWAGISHHDVSFVDVPGHERFLKNMLAGVEPIDVVLFVVAADEGWSAQSEEHLAILDLLGINPGVIALTKVDRVDADLAALAGLEIEERLAGTSLEGSPVISVSATTGAGLPELIAALETALSAKPPSPVGPPTLWIDRVFSAPGAGTVVTGSLTGGVVTVGDLLELQPGGVGSRVRTIQSHESDRREVGPGRRVALGVPDIPRESAVRGSVLAPPGTRLTTELLLAEVQPARGQDPDQLRRGAFHLHLGTGDWPVRVRFVDERTILLHSTRPVPAAAGDRFILRDAGRRVVVGGGRILDPDPNPRAKVARRSAEAILPVLEMGPDAVADALLAVRGHAQRQELRAWTGGGEPSQGTVVGDTIFHDTHLAALCGRALSLAAEYHSRYPLRQGAPKAQLATDLRVSVEVVDALVGSEPRLAADGSYVSLVGHAPSFDAGDESEWSTVRARLEDAGMAPPRGDESVPDEELRHLLVRQGKLVPVGGFLYLPATLEQVRADLGSIPQPFTVSQAKEVLGISRKHAVPLLEWCDANGVTRRSGDQRTLRDPAGAPPGP